MSDKKHIQMQMLVTGLQSKVDGSIKMTLETREIPAETAVELFSLRNKEAWVFMAADKMSQVMVPAEKPDSLVAGKTSAQRLRAVMYVLWQQQGKQGDFEDFYRQKMERLIEQYKELLE